jgi:hypothetical protein
MIPLAGRGDPAGPKRAFEIMAKKKDMRPKKKSLTKRATAGVPPKKPQPVRTIRNTLKVGKLPDPEKLGKIADLAVPKVRLGGEASSTLDAVLSTKTPAQRALELCGKWYERLAGDAPRVLTAVASMMALRRAYAVAYRELHDAVGEHQAELDKAPAPEKIPAEFADFAVQYAMYLASKPFNEHDLMEGVIGTLLPWLGDVVDRHTEADTAAAIEEKVRQNEERRATPLPLSFKHTPAQEDMNLTRDRALVLVGWRNAVLWLLDQSLAVVQSQGFQTVRMLTKAPRPEDQHARLVRLPPSAWSGCANSDRDTDVMVAKFIAPAVGGPIDLVVFDDLSAANTRGFVGRDAFARAGDAHRHLKKWAAGMGAGLLAAVPLDGRELPDMGGSEFEQLKTFATLRPVFVTDGVDPDPSEPDEPAEPYYVVTVGTDASVFHVPKSTLDAYGSTLVVPGGDTIQ